MGDRLRYLIVSDGNIKKVTRKKMCEFYGEGENVLPEYAGKIIDMVEAVVSVKNRQVDAVLRLYPMRLKVNNQGGLDETYSRERIQHKLNSHQRPEVVIEGGVIKAENLFNRVRDQNKYDWEISPKLVNEIVNMLV